MIKFSKEKVLLLHQIMAEATGGSIGVRDEGLLDSALEGVFAGFGPDFCACFAKLLLCRCK